MLTASQLVHKGLLWLLLGMLLCLTGLIKPVQAEPGDPTAQASTQSLAVDINAVTQIQREQSEARLLNRLEGVLCKDVEVNDNNRELCARKKLDGRRQTGSSPSGPTLRHLMRPPEAAKALGLAAPQTPSPPPASAESATAEIVLPGPPDDSRYRLVAVFGLGDQRRMEVLINRKKRTVLEPDDRFFRFQVVRIFEDGVELRLLDKPANVRFYPIGALLR
jgi:hypothetical protein